MVIDQQGDVTIKATDNTRLLLKAPNGGGNAVAEYWRFESLPRWAIGRDLLAPGQAGIGFLNVNQDLATGGAAIGIAAPKTLNFFTSDGSSLQERMRIDSDGNVGIGTTAPDASAALEIESTSQGFLPPRMTGIQRNAIAAPVAAGLVIWCTNCGTDGELQVYNGTAWTNMVGGAASNPPIITVQQRLDGGETPKQIYDSGIPLDSLYGKTYQGGLIAYLNTTTGTGLIAATSDQSTAIQWYNGSYTLTGATGTGIGTGQSNTNAIITSQGAGSYAASLCDGYSVTVGAVTYNDWYLPSKDELYQMYKNLHRYGCTAAAPGGTDNTSCSTSLGGFAYWNYWSSSGYGSNLAWGQSFFNGGQIYYTKYATGRVRAVRAF
jgi:hypothetical protein